MYRWLIILLLYIALWSMETINIQKNNFRKQPEAKGSYCTVLNSKYVLLLAVFPSISIHTNRIFQAMHLTWLRAFVVFKCLFWHSLADWTLAIDSTFLSLSFNTPKTKMIKYTLFGVVRIIVAKCIQCGWSIENC